MNTGEPSVNLGNLYILFNLIFALLPLVLMPYVVLSMSFIIVHIFGAAYCTADACTSVQRAGSIVVVVGILYTYVQEFWLPSANDMGKELRNDFSLNLQRSEAGSRKLVALLDATIAFTEKSHKFAVRSVEIALLAGGTFINGFGDLIWPHLL
ncbi:MAG: hypothetical protein K2Y27_10230 [Xanthobacteraceae bacterium]|nr:hypothetical protein [Xanthobacteraceae bacterium]